MLTVVQNHFLTFNEMVYALPFHFVLVALAA